MTNEDENAFYPSEIRSQRGSARSRPGAKLCEAEEAGTGPNTIAAGQLRAFIERIECVTEEIEAYQDDRKEIYAEAKDMGFDTKAIRTIIRLRKKNEAERQEEEAVLDTYKAALGMA